MTVNEYDEIIDSIQKEQAPQAANPYEDIINEDKKIQGQVIRASMLGSLDKNPDEQANAIKLAERTKLPIGTVTRNYNNVKKKDILATTDYDKIIEETPALAKLISDPNTAAAVHDDLDKLGRVEATANRLKPLSEEGSLSDIKNAMGSGFNSMLGSTGHLFSLFDVGVDKKEVYKFIAERNKAAKELKQKYPEYYKKFEETRQKEWADVTEGANQFKKSIEELKNNDIQKGLWDFAAGGASTVGQALDYAWAHIKNPKSSAIMMSEQMSQNLPSYTLGAAGGAAGTATGAALGTATVPIIGTVSGAAILGGAGAYSGAFMGGVMTEVGSEMNQLLEQRGYDITSAESIESAYSNPELIKELKDMAIRKGVTTSAVDSLFTVVAGKFLSKAKGTGIVSKAKAIGKEVAAQTVGESGSEFAGQVAEYKGDISKVDPQSVFDEGLLSLGHSMKEVVTHAGIKNGKILGFIPLRKTFSEDPVKATEELADKNKVAFKATNDAEVLKTLGEQVKETKTKQRIPEKLSELIDTATQGRGTENIYFQKDAWDNYWNGKGMNPARAYDQIMGSSKKYNEVEETGGQLSLPLSKYVTQLVDTEHYEGLLADTMTSPDSMSLRDAKNLFENNSALLNTFANESLKSTAETDIESTPEFKQVYDDIYRQAKEAGRSTREAENLALINARQTAIRANIRGQKLEDFYKGMQIQYFDTPAQVEAGQFTQAPPEVVQERSRLSELLTSTFKAHQEAKKERESVKKVLLNTLKTKLPEEQATKLINDLTSGVTRGMMYDAAQAIRNVAPDLDIESYMAANDKYYSTLSSDRMARDRFNQFSDKNKTYFQVTNKADINTKEFKDWFKDSKVVDKNGKPKIVYHGTNYDFDAFNYDKMGEKGTTMGRGFYFSENKNQSKGYGKNVIEAYISIQKPASLEERTITKQQIKELIESHKDTTDALSNYGDVNYEGYNKVLSAAIKSIDSLTNDVDIINSIGSDIYHNQWDQYFPIVKENLGFDGTIVKDGKYTNYVVFNPNQIKSVYNKGSFSPSSDNIYYQTRQVVDTFYSKMIKTVEEKMGGSASVEQVNGMLKEIKPEERKWMQLDEFLKGKEKVSKEELLNFLNANQLHIEEKSSQPSDERITLQKEMNKIEKDIDKVTDKIVNEILSKNKKLDETDVRLAIINLGDPNYNEAARKYHTDYLTKNLKITEEEALKLAEPRYKKIEELSENINKQKNLRDSFRPIYEQYSIQGGENYREVLFKLPASRKLSVENAEVDGEYVVMDHDSSRVIYQTTDYKDAENYLKSELERQSNKQGDFTSGHFNREANILAFTRLKDRVDADGKKVLFIEEIQSDWHQEGRKKGYKGDKKENLPSPNIQELLNESDIKVEETSTHYVVSPENSDLQVFESRSQKITVPKTRVDSIQKAKEYALKLYNDVIDVRNIQSQNKYDELKIDKGVPDAPLKKTWHEFVLKRLIREAAEKGYDKIAWTTGEQQAERYDLSKQIGSVTYNSKTKTLRAYKPKESEMAYNGGLAFEEAGIEENSIEEYIGKDAAKKLLDSKQNKNGVKELDGLDLKTGGEGMKGFYDQMIPSFLNKFGKKYGAKVEDAKINIPQVVEYAGHKKYGEEFKWAIKNSDGSILSEYKGDPNLFRSKEDAQNYIKENNMIDGQKVHSLEITHALKEAALYEGFTLFQKESDLARGQIRIGNTKLNIDIFKDANESTLFHESGHAFLENMKDDFKFISELDQTKLTETQKDFLARAKDVLEWLGVDSFDALERAHHEKWARGFEAYLMEGKAPTSKLRAAFAAFKVWLVNIYRQLRNLNVELSPEIRSVMDRLVATEEEIQTEMGASEMKPLFGDPKFQGMSEENVKKYLKAQEEAQNYAKEQVEQKVLKQYMRTKESWYKEKRDAIKADIDKDLNSRRVYKALSILQKGKMPDGSELPQGVMAIKIDKDSLVRKYGKEILDRLPKPYVYKKEGGVDVDMAASMLGYEDANTMLQEIVNSPKKDLLSKQMTDAKMNELYPDIMMTNELPEEVKKALHNEKRVEMLRMELEHLASNNMPVLKEGIRRITKMPPTNKQVKAEAFKKVSSLDVQDIKPNQFLKAEQKARKEAGELFAKGNIEGAFDAKLKELLNHEMYNVAIEVKEKIESDKELFKKFQRKDEDISKTRDMDLVNAGRAVLAQYGIGKMDKAPSEYLDLIKQYDPEMYDHVSTLVEDAVRPVQDRLAMKDNYKSISYRDYLNFSDTIKTIWDLAKSTRETELDGVKLDIGTMANELAVETMQFLKEKTGEQKTTATTKDRAIRTLLGARAALRRVESWCDYMDGGKANGIFKKYIFNLISKASSDYRIDKNYYITKYLDNLKKIEGSLKDQKPIDARELGQGVVFNSKSDLITALLHTGNESNLSKLLRGRNWGVLNADGSLDKSKWNKFMARMYAEKIVTKADYDFAQSVWDLMEEMKPKLQKAHKKMYGYYFNEVTADEVDTPFGKYKGGYVPAKADPFYSNDAASRAMKEMLEKNSNSFAFPTTTRGSTKQRVEAYAAPLNLNLRMVVSHIDWAARFANIEPKVKDVIRVIKNKELKSTLYELDPTLLNDMFNPWLQRAAMQQVSFSSEGNAGALLDNIARGLRKRTGMNAMFANITNTIQQITGFSITAVKVKPRNIRNAMWTYMQKPNKVAEEIRSKSKFMQTRTDNSLSDSMNTIEEITLNPSKYEKFVDFAQKHAYFFQSTAQNFVDNVSWMGAYNQSIENGMSEQDAINHADSVVRLTQGSQAAEDVSRYETGTPFMRLFTMFYSYFNMQSNLLGTEFSVAMRDLGLKKGAGRALYVYTLGFMIPAVMSELLVLGMSGKGLDEDDDDQYLDDAMQLFFGSQFNTLTAMIPMAGSSIKPAIGAFTAKPYDDKISSSPAITSIEATVRAPADIYKAFFEDGSKKKAVQDTLTAVALITGVPVSALGRPAGYLLDVNEGKANPSNPIDYTRGLITGKSGK